MMKIVSVLAFLLFLQNVNAQKVIFIATDQTTNLVFPSAILHVDRGTKDVLVQIVKESERIILVKAGSRDFHPTSMSVLTADGNLFSFIVRYDSMPSSLVYTIQADKKAGIVQYAREVLNRPAFLNGVKDHSWQVHSRITGIYIKDSLFFFQLLIDNRSKISYDIDQLRFYIRDKRTAKRSTVQENELSPLYKEGNMNSIPANASTGLVFAFPKFTIPDAKSFIVEITERNGGRKLKLKLGNAKLMKTIPLSDLNN